MMKHGENHPQASARRKIRPRTLHTTSHSPPIWQITYGCKKGEAPFPCRALLYKRSPSQWSTLLSETMHFQLLPRRHTSHNKPHAILHSLLIDAIREALTWNMHATPRHKAESLGCTWVPKWLEFRHCNGKELAPRDCTFSDYSSFFSAGRRRAYMNRFPTSRVFYLTEPNWKTAQSKGVCWQT